MGSKKDIHIMFSDLLNSVRDRETASKIADIRELVSMIQAAELMTKEENLDLRNEISSLKKQLLRSIKILSRLKTKYKILQPGNSRLPSQITQIQGELFPLLAQPANKLTNINCVIPFRRKEPNKSIKSL